MCAALTRLETEFQYVDLFDESDALLRHKYQLMYAAGFPIELKAGPERWYMVQVIKSDRGLIKSDRRGTKSDEGVTSSNSGVTKHDDGVTKMP